MPSQRIAILGGGNMGSAIARAIRDNQSTLGIPPSQITIAEPDSAKHTALRADNAWQVLPTAREALHSLAPDGLIVIAVKPQLFPTLAAELGDVGPRLIISVMAGCSAARIHRDLGGRGRIIRVMPNLPVIYNQGMSALCPGPDAAPADLDFTRQLFSSLGHCIDIPESLMDAFTAVASSGPAYVFYLAEAMTTAAIELGFTHDAARDMVTQTIKGTAAMLEHTPAETLRQQVTSKGGTTQAATTILDNAQVPQAINKAIRAAQARGQELSLPTPPP